MKNILILVFFLTTCLEGFSQVLVYKEYFNNGIIPANWKNIDQDGDGNKWAAETFSNNLTNINESYVYSELWKNSSALTPENYLISPKIDLTGLQGRVSLRYTIQVGDGTFPSEHYKVVVSAKGNDVDDFTEIVKEETCTVNDYSDSSTWHERRVDLTQFIGKQIYISWCHCNSPDGYILRLDSIQVSYTTNVGLNKQTEIYKVITYPNPVKNSLQVTGTFVNAKMKLFTSDGRQVYCSEKVSGQNTVNVSSLKKGLYILRIESSDGIVTKRINISY